MAKIVIIMGRGSSGKSLSIDSIADKLGLVKPNEWHIHFVKYAGHVEEITTNNIKEVLIQRDSIQERNHAILEKVLADAQEWIDYLKGKLDVIAIIPFTLRNDDLMRDLILKPLNMFRESSNEVILIYFKKENMYKKALFKVL